MKTLSATELAEWLGDRTREPPLLIDVREPWEHAICRIEGAELIPMRTVPQATDRIDPSRPIVCICHKGGRSAQVAMFLERNGYSDVTNLTGGIEAWARLVDPSMAKY